MNQKKVIPNINLGLKILAVLAFGLMAIHTPALAEGGSNYIYDNYDGQNYDYDDYYPNQNPSVSLRADDTNIDFEDSTILRWSSNDATRCDASGGTNGWSDNNIGTHGTFNTGSLDRDETYRITCRNSYGDTDTDSVTVRVDDDDNDNNNDDEPDVTTRNASNINAGSATLNGRVDGNGFSTRAWFEYGTNRNLTYSTSKSSYDSGSTNYNKNISGLYANTTYYFRSVAENSRGIVYGNIFTFYTSNGFVNIVNNPIPVVTVLTDQASVPLNGTTTIRWVTTNATSCNASGGSLGWAGVKSIGPGFFVTGALGANTTYTMTCSNNSGSASDSKTITIRRETTVVSKSPVVTPVVPTSLVLITSSVDRNQPIVSTLDNTKPQPGDEINYNVGYQNIGTGEITQLTLNVTLPQEVNFMFANGNNPSIFGNTLVFDLGKLGANSKGMVEIRVKVRDSIPTETNLNFPATLSYIDPSNSPKSVSANVSAQVWSEPVGESTPENTNKNEDVLLGANVFGAGFLPTNLFEWLLLFTLILILISLAKYIFEGFIPLSRQTITTSDHPHADK